MSQQALRINTNFLYYRNRNLLIALISAFSFNQLVTPVLASSQPNDNWAELQRRGVTALDANQYWIAEPTLKRAMMQAELSNPKDIRLAKSLAELGRLYTIRGHFDEAESYLEEELSIRELVSGNDRYKCIPTMGSLIQFYITYGTRNKAEPLTEEMLSLVEGKLNEARAGSTKVRFQKGEPLQGWLGVAAPVMKDPIIEWAITCDAVGNCHRAAGNLDLANRLFNAALDIKTTVLGNNHLSLANSYDSLGGVCLEKKHLAEAESYFTDALNITEKTLSPESPQVYSRLDKLAKCLIKEGKYREAEQLYLRALTFWKSEPLKHDNEARALFALGSLYSQEHKYEEAVPYFDQALQLAEEINGPNSIAIVPYLQKYAYTLYYLGRKGEIEDISARVATISGPK